MFYPSFFLELDFRLQAVFNNKIQFGNLVLGEPINRYKCTSPTGKYRSKYRSIPVYPTGRIQAVFEFGSKFVSISTDRSKYRSNIFQDRSIYKDLSALV